MKEGVPVFLPVEGDVGEEVSYMFPYRDISLEFFDINKIEVPEKLKQYTPTAYQHDLYVVRGYDDDVLSALADDSIPIQVIMYIACTGKEVDFISGVWRSPERLRKNYAFPFYQLGGITKQRYPHAKFLIMFYAYMDGIANKIISDEMTTLTELKPKKKKKAVDAKDWPDYHIEHHARIMETKGEPEIEIVENSTKNIITSRFAPRVDRNGSTLQQKIKEAIQSEFYDDVYRVYATRGKYYSDVEVPTSVSKLASCEMKLLSNLSSHDRRGFVFAKDCHQKLVVKSIKTEYYPEGTDLARKFRALK